jgi:hypothetical protein
MFVKNNMNPLVADAKCLSEADGSEFGWLLTNFQTRWISKEGADSGAA